MPLKKTILSFIKLPIFQPIWEKTHRYSLIGMNYWGGCNVNESGEISVIKLIYNKLNKQNEIVIFDVGANVGKYLEILVSLAPNNKNVHIHCFEPSKNSFKILSSKQFANNKIKAYYNNFGLSNSSETKELFSSSKTATIASLYNLRSPENDFKQEYSEQVHLSTISDYCQQNKITAIDFLKLDIEGHELNALHGALDMINSNAIKHIQFEFGNCNIDSKSYMRDFFDILQNNYHLYRILPNGIRLINSYSEDLEIFATSNFLAILK